MNLSLVLQPQHERQCAEIAPELVAAGFDFLLHHQQEHYAALEAADIVVNTNATGAGKTLASLLHMVRPHMQKPETGDVLMIAPTNELIAQHAEDIKEFVNSRGLPHIALQVNAGVISTLTLANGWRRGEAFHNLLRNPRDPVIAPHLNLGDSGDNRRPVIIVTNPDLFYYALSGRYQRLDRRNLATELIGKFKYVIVDEFHYYTPKQAAAFFLYIAILAKFGFFADGARMSFLTATPEEAVNFFFRNLEISGIRVTRVEPNPVPSNDKQATMSLTETHLTFVASDEGMEKAIESQLERIRERTVRDFDAAVISNSLADINGAARRFRKRFPKNEYQTITGAVATSFRREAARARLIFATPTVDIGYNFPRPGKNRQGLDDIYFTARRPDEFWQRLGRVGRVIKKPEQDVASNAVCVINSAAFEKLQALNIDTRVMSREELKSTLQNAEVFEPRVHFWKYVANEGLFEAFHALDRLGETFTLQERPVIEEVYGLLTDIFGAEKAPSWKCQRGRLARYHTLDGEASKVGRGDLEFPTSVLREFAAECAKRRPNASAEEGVEIRVKEVLDTEIKEQFVPLLKEHEEWRRRYVEYIQCERDAIAGMFAFRDAFSGVPVLAFDKARLFHPDQAVTRYDVFHLLKNCEIHLYPGREQFLADLERNGGVNDLQFWRDEESPLYLRIDGLRDRGKRWQLGFRLEVPNIKTFERLDTDRLRVFRELQPRLFAQENSQTSEIPVPPELIAALSKARIPILAFGSETYVKAANRLRTAGFLPYDLKVNDLESPSPKLFKTLIGTNAYYVTRLAHGIRAAIERYESYYIC